VNVLEARGLEVVRAGPRTTVQDTGRAGLAHLGVPRSGALDPQSLALANRLVGNTPDAAGLEITLGGCALRATGRGVTIAVTGAQTTVTVDGRPVDWGGPVGLRPGQCVAVGAAVDGLRCYLAVGGGIAVAPVLGSRSTDTLSGLGPPALADGTRLPVGPATPGSVAAAGVDIALWSPAPDPLVLRVRLGPRADWFTPEALGVLTSATWLISASTDRVGARLDGPALERVVTRELPSEGVGLGSVQVPADGHPLVFLADHPTTGGYPVVAVVDRTDLPPVAQARPGTRVRLTTSHHRGTRAR